MDEFLKSFENFFALMACVTTFRITRHPKLSLFLRVDLRLVIITQSATSELKDVVYVCTVRFFMGLRSRPK